MASYDDATDPIALARTRWHWDLPQDLGQRGWDADLALWVACRELPAVREFEHLLARTNRPRHLATMARYLINNTDNTHACDRIYRCLKRALSRARPIQKKRPKHGVKPLRPPEVEHELFLVGDYIDPILQCAAARRDHALATALAHYIGVRLHPSQQIALLTRLLRLGLTEVRFMLTRLAADLRAADKPRPAADALAAALSPVDQPLFAST